MYTSWAMPLCLGKVQFLRLAVKEHKRRRAARQRGTTTATGGTGKGQQGDRRHDNGNGRHDDGDGRHDNGRRQGAAEKRILTEYTNSTVDDEVECLK
jgi:hypothetical protein